MSELWLNDTTRSLRRACRVAERKWKKDKLKISLEMMQDALYEYQRAVKSAKTNYFSDVVAMDRQLFLMFLILLLIHVIQIVLYQLYSYVKTF